MQDWGEKKKAQIGPQKNFNKMEFCSSMGAISDMCMFVFIREKSLEYFIS